VARERKGGGLVNFRLKARDLPGRVAAGAYILHAGLEKGHADDARARGLHKAASGAFPVLERIPPERFTRLLAASEIAIGSALLVPAVPSAASSKGCPAGACGGTAADLLCNLCGPIILGPGAIDGSMAWSDP
jgi:hypothetical protein